VPLLFKVGQKGRTNVIQRTHQEALRVIGGKLIHSDLSLQAQGVHGHCTCGETSLTNQKGQHLRTSPF